MEHIIENFEAYLFFFGAIILLGYGEKEGQKFLKAHHNVLKHYDEAEEAPEAIKLRFVKLQNEALATISRDVLTIKLAVIIGVGVWLATTLGIFSIS